jgi:hypothetical protein
MKPNFGKLEVELNSSSENTRWAAAAALSDFVESHPDEVWAIVHKSGCSDDGDLRMAVATCVLEHLLEHHFDDVYPRVEALALADARFADTFLSCWKFGQSEIPKNEARFEELRRRLSDRAT